MDDAASRSAVTVLCVDDEEGARWALEAFVRKLGYTPALAETGAKALAYLSTHAANAVLLDVRLPDMSGQEVLREIRARHNAVPVIMLTGYAETSDAAAALEFGVEDYLTKPYEHLTLERLLRKALAGSASATGFKPERARARARLIESVGVGHRIQDIVHEVESFSETDLTVLLEGETGTGKELFARAIHDLSPRSGGPFVVVDCGAIPEELFESELFGHRKGAFTGADQETPGLLASARGGSIFFDEIDSLPLLIQPKLLRVIESREYRRIGCTQMKKLDIRVIAGSAQSLDQLVRKQRFRGDLYYRLAECVLRIPPLREHTEDIRDLALHFLRTLGRAAGPAAANVIPQEAIELFQRHSWPGNVRELRNTIRQAMLLNGNRADPLSYEQLRRALNWQEPVPETPPPASCEHATKDAAPRNPCDQSCPLHPGNISWAANEPVPLKDIVKSVQTSVEQWILTQVLSQTKGNKALAARRLGLDYKTLCNKLRSSVPGSAA